MENLKLNRLIMKIQFTLLLAAILSVVACNTKEKNKVNPENSHLEMGAQAFEFSTWITSDKEKSTDLYAVEFKKYKDHGIDEVLINTLTDPKELQRLVPVAKAAGLKVHAWIMTMNRPGDTIAQQHPEWYAVSKQGKSCYDTRPYVDYYQ
jgi:exo-beta-1,3-glucanase (GH17 family)